MQIETLLIEKFLKEYTFHCFMSGYTLLGIKPNKLILKTNGGVSNSSDVTVTNNYVEQILLRSIKENYPELTKYFDIIFNQKTFDIQSEAELIFNLKPKYKDQEELLIGYLRIQGILK